MGPNIDTWKPPAAGLMTWTWVAPPVVSGVTVTDMRAVGKAVPNVTMVPPVE